jgi:hypothetical protein
MVERLYLGMVIAAYAAFIGGLLFVSIWSGSKGD